MAGPGADATPPLTVLLFGRAECHLCDEAERMLARIARTIPMTVQLIDIDADDYLQRLYMLEIPVVMANGKEVARAPISEGRLEDALQAAMNDAASR